MRRTVNRPNRSTKQQKSEVRQRPKEITKAIKGMSKGVLLATGHCLAVTRKSRLGCDKGPGTKGGAFLHLVSCITYSQQLLVIVNILVIVDVTTGLAKSCVLHPVVGSCVLPNSFRKLIHVLLFLTTVCLAKITTACVRCVLLGGVKRHAIAQVHRRLFNGVRHLPIECFSARRRNSIVDQCAGSVSHVDSTLASDLSSVLSDTLAIVNVFYLVVFVDPVLATMALVAIPLVFLDTGNVIGQDQGCFGTRRRTLKVVGNCTRRVVDKRGIIGMFKRRRGIRASFKVLGRDLGSGSLGTRFCSKLVVPIVRGLGALGCIVVAVIKTLLTVFHKFSMNKLTTFLRCSQRFNHPVGRLTDLCGDVRTTVTKTRHVFRVVSRTPRGTSIPRTIALGGVGKSMTLGGICFNCHPRGAVLGKISLRTPTKGGVTLMNTAKTKGAAVLGLLPHFFSVRSKRVAVSGRPVSQVRHGDLHHSVTVILRSARLFANAMQRGVHFKHLDTASSRMITTTHLATTRSFVGHLPRKCSALLRGSKTGLDRKRQRLLGVTHTTITSPTVLLLSRTADGVSAHDRVLVRQKLSRLVRKHADLVVTRHLSAVHGTSAVLMLRRKRVVRRNDRRRLLTLGKGCCSLGRRRFGWASCREGHTKSKTAMVPVQGECRVRDS